MPKTETLMVVHGGIVYIRFKSTCIQPIPKINKEEYPEQLVGLRLTDTQMPDEWVMAFPIKDFINLLNYFTKTLEESQSEFNRGSVGHA